MTLIQTALIASIGALIALNVAARVIDYAIRRYLDGDPFGFKLPDERTH